MSEEIKGHCKGFWGILDHQGRRLYMRRTKIVNDISATKLNKYAPPYKCYTFGEDNHKYLLDQGFESKLLDKRPIVWDMDKQQFRHKLEILKVASQEHDKFVFSDWDMMWIKPIPNDFWEVLAKKETYQAIMGRYKRRKVFDRKHNQHDIPSGSFVYIGDKSVPDKFIQIWKDLGEIWSEEVVFNKYAEQQMKDKTFSLDEYWNRFEPMYFQLRTDIYTPEQMALKTPIVQHFNMRGISYLLRHTAGFEYMRAK
jgi:hypothetical protein